MDPPRQGLPAHARRQKNRTLPAGLAGSRLLSSAAAAPPGPCCAFQPPALLLLLCCCRALQAAGADVEGPGGRVQGLGHHQDRARRLHRRPRRVHDRRREPRAKGARVLVLLLLLLTLMPPPTHKQIKGYPTLKVYHKGEEVKAYRGERSGGCAGARRRDACSTHACCAPSCQGAAGLMQASAASISADCCRRAGAGRAEDVHPGGGGRAAAGDDRVMRAPPAGTHAQQAWCTLPCGARARVGRV